MAKEHDRFTGASGPPLMARTERLRRRLAQWLSALLRRHPRLRRTFVLRPLLILWESVGNGPAALRDVQRALAARPRDPRIQKLARRYTSPVDDADGRKPARRTTVPALGAVEKTLADFLYFGYLPSRNAAARVGSEYRTLLADESIPVFDPANLESVRSMLVAVVGTAIDKHPNARFVVGLSSGYDSRTLLAGLLELIPADRVACFTSGHPGNADFDLAPLYCDGVVEQHELIDIGASVRPELKALERRARRSPPGMPRAIGIPREPAPPQVRALMSLPRLHGFLGEISGSRLPDATAPSYEQAKEEFTRKQARFVKRRFQAEFLPPGYEPRRHLPDSPDLPSEVLGFEDQLDLFYRQHQLIRTLSSQQFAEAELSAMPAAMQVELRAKRDRTLVPFADDRWRRSFLLAPLAERRGRALLKRCVGTYYPEIFKELANPDDPRFDATGKPRTVHSAWSHLWREDEQFRSLVVGLLLSLRRRRLWFDPMLAVEIADAGERYHGLLLQGLCSLEVNLRVGKL